MSSETFQQLKKATSGQTQSLSQRMRASGSAPELNQRKSKPSQLPPVSPTTRVPVHTAFDLYTGTGISKSVHNRLAGLNDPFNTTGLFADNTHPPRPLPMCVRCGDSPNMCMKCAEQECENTLTFYRKTRAAGAATLFTKAFVEAGYSKLIKFVVFRLLKNSCQARSRVRMKKKAVVEKLFGTNLVYLPFNAWRRFTRENVLARKNKAIEEQSDRVKALEIQNQKLTMQLRDASHEIDFLKGEVRTQGNTIHEMSLQIDKLKKELAREQDRVKSLSALAVPLAAVCNTLNRAIEHDMEDTGVELNSRAHVGYSYNMTDVLDHKTLRSIKDFHETATSASTGLTASSSSSNRKAPNNTTATAKSVSNRAFFAVSGCLARWVNALSASAGNRTEPVSGKSLETFLPKHEDIEDITDLRNGKILSRVILALIIDRQVLDREKANVFASQSLHSLSTAAQLEQYSYGSWPSAKITFEDIEVLSTKAEHAMELLEHILRLASRCLEIKTFQAAEVFSGYRDWLWHLVMSLMNASLPTVTQHDYALIDACIHSYYRLMQTLSEREPLREHMSLVHQIVDQVYTVDVPLQHQHHPNSETADRTDTHHQQYAELSKILLSAASDDDVSEMHSVSSPKSASKHHQQHQHHATHDTHASSSPLRVASLSIDDTFPVQQDTAAVLDTEAHLTTREVHLQVSWDTETYHTLGHLVDEMVLHRTHLPLVDYAVRLIDSYQQLRRLRSQVVTDRRKRDDGVRLTTDVRQFLFTQLLRVTDPHSVMEENNSNSNKK